MAIKPVDMKNLMPKTQQLSKIQQNENDRQKNFIHIQNSNQAKKAEHEKKLVKSSEKASNTKITNENNRNNNKKHNNKDNNDSNTHEEKSEKNSVTSVLGINIDIKV